METTNTKPQFEAVSVELLGKPIHSVRENLEGFLAPFALTLRHSLQSWLKNNQVDVRFQGVELHTLRLDDIDKETLSTFKHDDGGFAYVHLDAATLIALSDSFYGASVARSNTVLTASDKRLQERIGKLVIGTIAPDEMWTQSEFEPGYDMGLRATLDIQFGEHSGQLTMDIEGNLIRTLIEELGLQSEKDLSDAFSQSLATTPVRLNVLLSKKTMPLSDVLDLAPNDILPIELLTNVPVSIGNEQLFTGRVAEQDGQLVLTLNHE
ncbi:FliM/FliN family flagellar motor switch protein [Grimontia sp. NTOU-MAR1]|uniref:FliM/FliN family flagellar motor switch protein n=1 Tax=Grimontia sp. NTOU-MAR1 TaxID=3111011 RepID=UPI002DB7EEF7|nr:FliM/FliN family flagellar motor switch protein [Grimontia sp. NTOU-MAR1]WRV98715.1 FliM/FliN family flagellar motor switch protein [Grimontia sp. NTOU-MAR1]